MRDKQDIIDAFQPDIPVDERYCYVVAGIESSHRPDAQATTSSATGLYQFINATWLDMFRKYVPWALEKHGKDDVLNMRFDPDISRAVFEAFTDDNRKVLTDAKLPVTYGGLYLAHFLGVGGARRVLSAEPDDTVRRVCGPSVVGANQFLTDKTIEWLIEWAERKTS